jgi:outer membrane protein
MKINCRIKSTIPKILVGIMLITNQLCAQNQLPRTLSECIAYAEKNNIGLRQKILEVKIAGINLSQSRVARYPKVNASLIHTFTNQIPNPGTGNWQQSFTGNYGSQADMILYNGNKLNNNILLNNLQLKSSELGVLEAAKLLEINITTAFLNVLQAREMITQATNTIKSSESQLNRAKVLLEAGYIAQSNYAQFKSQLSADKYTLAVNEENYYRTVLEISQLLELSAGEMFDPDFPEITDSAALIELPSAETILKIAIANMPSIENNRVNLAIAQKNMQIARAGFFPAVTLGAGISSAYNTLSTNSFSAQLGDNINQNAGLNITIPIFNGNQTKASVSKAKINVANAGLAIEEGYKTLEAQVETARLNAVTAQKRLVAAAEQLDNEQISYSLIEEQFNLGMKNTVDLLIEKTKLLTSFNNKIQARYEAILYRKVLDALCNIPIEL